MLDNFEQLVAAAHVVRGWCQRAPELRVVVTSRERLAVEGEVVLELPPLSCPQEGDGEAEVLEGEAVLMVPARASDKAA